MVRKFCNKKQLVLHAQIISFNADLDQDLFSGSY